MLHAFFQKLRPGDIIAVIVLIFGFYLLLKGVDKVVSGCVIAVCTYYFVRTSHHDNTKTN